MSQLSKTISYRGVQLSVDYTYYPPSRGAREKGSGVQLEPDESASVDVDGVQIVIDMPNHPICNGYLCEVGGLLDGQEDEIEAKLLEELSDDEPDERC